MAGLIYESLFLGPRVKAKEHRFGFTQGCLGLGNPLRENLMNQILELHCQGCGVLITNASSFLEYHGFKACSDPCLNKIKSLPLWKNVFDVTEIDGKTIHGMLKRGLKRKGYEITKVEVLNVAHYQMKANVLFSLELIEGGDKVEGPQIDDFTYMAGKIVKPQVEKPRVAQPQNTPKPSWKEMVGVNKIFSFREPEEYYFYRGQKRPKEYGKAHLKVIEALSNYDGQPVENIRFSEIANEIGVSRQRVHQIFKKLLHA